jgi:Zn-dependent peptidase ImmA (M78 family)
MKIEDINRTVQRIIKRRGTRNPFELARELGVTIIPHSDFKQLKGMYSVTKGKRFIFLNSNLNSYKQRFVCAHELGHDQLHRVLASDNYYREFEIYDMTLRPEYEANVFAAELLLPDEDIIDLITLGYDNAQIAQALNSDTNLIGIKVSALSNRGYNYRIPDFRSDFLKGD